MISNQRNHKIWAAIVLSFLSIFFQACNSKNTDKDSKPATTTENPAKNNLSAIGKSAFDTLEVDKSVVEDWLKGGSPNFVYKRIVFNYYWPDTGDEKFTLIALRDSMGHSGYDPVSDVLNKLGACPVNLGPSLILGDNQISPKRLEKLMRHLDRTHAYKLYFIPQINAGVDEDGKPCNCPSYLVYFIQFNDLQNKARTDLGYTNPSPPKPPGN